VHNSAILLILEKDLEPLALPGVIIHRLSWLKSPSQASCLAQ